MTARVGILFSCYIESDSEPFYVIDYVFNPMWFRNNNS